MGSVWGNKLKISIFGESHGEKIGVVVDGFPAGIRLDEEKINALMSRRRASKAVYSTPRSEGDIPHIVSGIYNGFTSGAPICALIDNNNTRSGDYTQLFDRPRPGHADFTARIKYDGFNDPRGGGHFSGRLTACMTFAGALCMQLLEKRGITVGAHIANIGNVYDDAFGFPLDEERLKSAHGKAFPVLNEKMAQDMLDTVALAAKNCDSVGGSVECAAIGIPAGWGEPMFGSVESHISSIMFSIPAVKGVEFGAGFKLSEMHGSAANDSYAISNGKAVALTNNCGGILGGITNGMPLLFRVGIKPTPSIGAEQRTVDLKNNENCTIKISGRHDSCIVPRAVPVVEACCAIALADMLLNDYK